MKTVYKYPFKIDDYFELEMPKGAEVLSAQVQGRFEKPTIWALVDPQAKPETFGFKCYGTGHECRSPRENFIGTIQLANGELVFHVFRY